MLISSNKQRNKKMIKEYKIIYYGARRRMICIKEEEKQGLPRQRAKRGARAKHFPDLF
jgi:hypothetical protein